MDRTEMEEFDTVRLRTLLREHFQLELSDVFVTNVFPFVNEER